jgi:hypothetical protein
MLGNGRQALSDSLDIVTAELEQLIDRHFAARRELVVSNDEGKFWTAAIGDNVLYRHPDGLATMRFARTFAERTPGVDLVAKDWGASCECAHGYPCDEHSVRVPALRVVL